MAAIFSRRDQKRGGCSARTALVAHLLAKAAVAALLRAERDLGKAENREDEPTRVFLCTKASLAHQTAAALRDLGDLQGAEAQFSRSVRTREPA